MNKLLSAFYFILALHASSQDSHVLMISFDGFRHDYVELYDTPNFDRFILTGTAAKSIIPSYPSKTFPNHYTLVTGLYPGNHGLVDNSFYDSSMNVVYTMRKRDLVRNSHFYGGYPLWQWVQKNGLKSASYFWVGSEASIKGSFPDYYYPYDGSVSNEERISQVADWLSLPSEDRPRFISLYFSLVDDQGHDTGPVSRKTGKVVTEADRLLGLVMEEVKQSALKINVIVTSDHGMKAIRNTRSSNIQLDEYFDLDNSAFLTLSTDTHARLYFRDYSKIDSTLNAISQALPTVGIFTRENTPAHWYYQNNDRAGDVILTAPLGKVFSTKEWRRKGSKNFGVHGYDPRITTDMHGIFYANGPQIIESLKIESFENVHVYPLICELLGIPAPAGIDGKLRVLSSIMR